MNETNSLAMQALLDTRDGAKYHGDKQTVAELTAAIDELRETERKARTYDSIVQMEVLSRDEMIAELQRLRREEQVRAR